MQVVREIADQIARHVDRLLDGKWDRRSGHPLASSLPQGESRTRQATCSCGVGVPVQTLQVAGREVTLTALPLIFAQFREVGKLPSDSTKTELLQAVKTYNPVPSEEEAAYAQAVMQEYAAFCRGSS